MLHIMNVTNMKYGTAGQNGGAGRNAWPPHVTTRRITTRFQD